jgi:hypothetical protein
MHLRLAFVMVLVGVVAIWGTIYQRSLHTEAAPVAAFNNPLKQNIRVIDLSPKLIKTEIITSPEPEVKPLSPIKVAEDPKPEPKPESNLCTRHGMHKVYTNGGRSWRCRK